MMHRYHLITAALLLMVPSIRIGEAGTVTLPRRVTIAPPGDGPAYAFAAEELREFLVRTRAVGEAEIAQPGAEGFIRLSLSDDLAPEEIRYRIKGGGVAIEGGDARGLLFAVWEFCERELGVRFLTPAYTHTPDHGGSLTLGENEVRHRSPFPRLRENYYKDNRGDPLFPSRLRQHAVGLHSPRFDGERLGGPHHFGLINHSLHNYVPSRTYGPEHPEYFALIDGERRSVVEADWGGHGTQLCYSHPDVLRIVTEGVLEDLRKQPDRQTISVSQADNRYYCRCPDCAAINEREGSPMGALLTFVNRVAEAVETEFPDVLVGTLAYQWSRTPPANIKPRHNVLIQLSSIECCMMHAFDDPDCPLNRPFMDDLRAWARKTDKICYWIYVTNFQNYLLPCPNLGTLGRNLRVLRDHGAIGVMQQGPYNAEGGDFPELKNYVLARLLWDPDQDEAGLVREFVDLYYGDSAQGVMDILKRIQDHASPELHRYCFGKAAHYGLTPELGRELVLKFHDLIARETDATVRVRLEKASICAWRLLAEPWWPQWYSDVGPEPVAEPDAKIYEAFEIVPDPALPGPVAATLQLCKRHGLEHASEGGTITRIAERITEALGE